MIVVMTTIQEVAKERDPFKAVFGVSRLGDGRPHPESLAGRLLKPYPLPRAALAVSPKELFKARKRAERDVLMIVRALYPDAFAEIYEKELLKALGKEDA